LPHLSGIDFITLLGEDMARVEYRLRTFLDAGLSFDQLFSKYFVTADNYFMSLTYELRYSSDWFHFFIVIIISSAFFMLVIYFFSHFQTPSRSQPGC
jgi:hypothetical protein